MGSPDPRPRRHALRRGDLPGRVKVPEGLSVEPADDEVFGGGVASEWYVDSLLTLAPSPYMHYIHACRADTFARQTVYPTGLVCISILHPPGDDPLHYESASERWSPIQSVEKILISVMSMLAEPNDESPANVEAAVMWRERRGEFERRVREGVRRGLGVR